MYKRSGLLACRQKLTLKHRATQCSPTQSNATHRNATERSASHRNNTRSAYCCDRHSSACPGKAAHCGVYRRAFPHGRQQGVNPVPRWPAGGGQDLPRALHCCRPEQEVSHSCCWCCCSCRVCRGYNLPLGLARRKRTRWMASLRASDIAQRISARSTHNAGKGFESWALMAATLTHWWYGIRSYRGFVSTAVQLSIPLRKVRR